MHQQLNCLPTRTLSQLGAKADLLLLEPLPRAGAPSVTLRTAQAGPSYWLDIVAVERVLRSITVAMRSPSESKALTSYMQLARRGGTIRKFTEPVARAGALLLHGLKHLRRDGVRAADVESGSEGATEACSTDQASQARSV
eukprot:2117045-Prymnesium_polylepis.2